MLGRPIFLGALFLAAISVGCSFAHPWGDVRDVAGRGQILEGSAVPEEVRGIIEKKCGDCHSNETHWPVYSRFAPVSWLIERDVHGGRSALNFSVWAGRNGEDRVAALASIAAEVRSGEMPPKNYTLLHPANRLSESEKQQIVAWTRAERKRIKTEQSAKKETETREAGK